MIKMVVFDMAGTTVNEDNIVYKTLQTAINEAGFNVSLAEVLAAGAGKEKLHALKSILQAYTKNYENQIASSIYQKFKLLLSTAYDSAEIFPQNNALALFNTLRQQKIFVILNTGYTRETAEMLLEKLGWAKGIVFDDLITASDVAETRPLPGMIMLAMKRCNIANPAQVVKVGDSAIDIEEGKSAGCCLSIGITTGAHTRQQLQGSNPDYIIDDLMELLPLLNNDAQVTGNDV